MGRLYIPTEVEISGPWLLDHENLSTLNTLFNEIDNKLKEALAITIENTAKQQMEEENQTLDLPKRISKLQRKYNQKSKSAQISFSDGATYEAYDIEGILNYIDTNPTLSPEELYIRTIHGNHENEFALIIKSNASSEEVEFEYRIKCIDEEIQQKIKSLIDKWIRENKPHRLMQVWSKTIVYLIWIVGSLTILGSFSELDETVTKTESYKLELEKKAQNIIEKNSQINNDSTMLLVLKLVSDYVPENVKAKTTTVRNKGAWKVFISSSVLFIISLVRPRTIIGIGKKYNRLQLYKFWKTVIYATVGLLAGALVSDSFLHFINW